MGAPSWRNEMLACGVRRRRRRRSWLSALHESLDRRHRVQSVMNHLSAGKRELPGPAASSTPHKTQHTQKHL